MNTMKKEGVPRQRTNRGEGGGRGTGGIGWHRVTSLEEGAVSRVSAHRARGWAFDENKNRKKKSPQSRHSESAAAREPYYIYSVISSAAPASLPTRRSLPASARELALRREDARAVVGRAVALRLEVGGGNHGVWATGQEEVGLN